MTPDIAVAAVVAVAVVVIVVVDVTRVEPLTAPQLTRLWYLLSYLIAELLSLSLSLFYVVPSVTGIESEREIVIDKRCTCAMTSIGRF